jgi:hypothetical protein
VDVYLVLPVDSQSDIASDISGLSSERPSLLTEISACRFGKLLHCDMTTAISLVSTSQNSCKMASLSAVP